MIEREESNLTNCGSTAPARIKPIDAYPSLRVGSMPSTIIGPAGSSALYKAAFAAALANGLNNNTGTSVQGWIMVPNRDYLCAVGGGGIGNPSGSDAIALSTDATQPGELAIFRIELGIEQGPPTPGTFQFALQTPDGQHYVTAVNGGGIGNTEVQQPIVTNEGDPQTRGTLFTLLEQADGTVTIFTEDGHYVTAINGGNIGVSESVPIQTTATSIGQNERFTFIPARFPTHTSSGPGR